MAQKVDGFWVLSAQNSTPKIMTPVVSNYLDGTPLANWVNAAGPVTPDTNSYGFADYTIRQVIYSSQISNTGLTYCRVTFEASVDNPLSVAAAYIGVGSASGDVYDFDTTAYQLLFSGSASFSISAGQQQVSDSLAFSIPASRNLVVSYYMSSNGNVRAKASQTGWESYYKNASDASTVNATGYTGPDSYRVRGVIKVESG